MYMHDNDFPLELEDEMELEELIERLGVHDEGGPGVFCSDAARDMDDDIEVCDIESEEDKED